MEALDRGIKRLFEKRNIGILLFKGKGSGVAVYALARNLSPAIIANYENKLIDKKILLKKINQLAELFENKNLKNEILHHSW